MDVDVDPEREGTGGAALQRPAPVTEYWVGLVGFSAGLSAVGVCVFCKERGRGALVEPAPPAAPTEF
eukprot:352715-Rhodomonas_salina.1